MSTHPPEESTFVLDFIDLLTKFNIIASKFDQRLTKTCMWKFKKMTEILYSSYAGLEEQYYQSI